MSTEEPTQQAAADLQEIAEDMLDVLQRLENVERQVQEAAAGVTDLRRLVEDSASRHTRALDAMRSEVSGERRAVALRLIFEPVATALDSLELMARGLEGSLDQAAYAQVKSATATLANVLLALGYQRFDVARGDPFDAARMQCLGYEDGEPGVVLNVLHPGYAVSNVVVRPARVLIADPAANAVKLDPARDQGGHREA